MLWHFYGLQGSGKSWGVTVFAEDFYIKESRKVFANFRIEFGELIDTKKLMDFEYNDCVLILDEAYGVADSHKTSKANDTISYVILQSRKRKVEVFFATQNEGDLYRRIRESAHRKVLCQNIGTDKKPYLRYYITDQYNNFVDALEFDTETVRSAYHLFDTEEVIMPMYLNTGCTFENVKEVFNDSKTKRTFTTLLCNENVYMTGDIASSIYDLMSDERYDRVKKLLKVSK
jgi:hypothetical protein